MSDSPTPNSESVTPDPAAEAEASAAGSDMATAVADPPNAAPLPLSDFGLPSPRDNAVMDDSPELAAISLLDDVELEVKIELGRAQMYIEDVLRLGIGSVIELDKLAGDPVDVFINERLVARGEVLILNENLCVRINEIVNPTPEFEQTR
jgi:flagellar motor switch protein FliN/FliY